MSQGAETLRVITGFDGGSIYVDGEYGGGTTWTSSGSTVSGLPERTYALRVTKDGYQDWITEIDILADQTTTVEATLTKLS